MDKKRIAALSAVVAMLSEEVQEVYIPVKPPTLPHPYSAYGRQLTMHYRDITQRRIIKRNK